MDDAPDRGYSRAPELEDLVELIRALEREGARYVLIGGFAVILHGFVRGTKDIDLLVDPSRENIRAVKRALATLPDNAAALLADDVGGVEIPVASKQTLIRTKETIRGSDATDVEFLRLKLAEEEGAGK